MQTKRIIILCFAALLLLMFGLSSCAKKQTTQKDKDAAVNFLKLAIDYLHNQNTVAALKTLEEAKRFDPKNKDIYNLYGLIYLGKSRYQLAEEALRKALEIDPDYSETHVNLGVLYMQQGMYEKALKTFQYPSKDLLYPRKEIIYDNMGWCYHKLGKHDQAVEHLRVALTENPKFCHAWYNLGLVYKNTSEYNKAINAFQKAIKHCPKFMIANYHLALTAIRAKNYQVAKGALEECIRLGGDTDEAKECLNHLEFVKKFSPVEETTRP